MAGPGESVSRELPKVYVSQRLGRATEIVLRLESAGCQTVLGPVPRNPRAVTSFTRDEINRYFSDVDAILVGMREMISPDVIKAVRNLKVVCSYFIGTEFIDVPACTEMGVVVGFGAVPDNFLGVAEAIVMLSTALLKEFPTKYNTVRSGGWMVPDAGRMVSGSTIGMIGLGNVGRAVAKRLQGWECHVICCDPYVKQADADPYDVRMMDLDTLLKAADVVSVQSTLTPETHHLISDREFDLMRKDAYIVNTARGPVIDEAALTRALDGGKIAGAALDVWEEEPTPADNPLRTHPRVIATAHNVGHPQRLYDLMVSAAMENVLRPLRGEPPLYVRNPSVLPAWRERLATMGITPGTA